MKIICEWAEKNRYLQNFNGQVYPCCYLVQIQTQKLFNGTNRPEEQEIFKNITK